MRLAGTVSHSRFAWTVLSETPRNDIKLLHLAAASAPTSLLPPPSLHVRSLTAGQHLSISWVEEYESDEVCLGVAGRPNTHRTWGNKCLHFIIPLLFLSNAVPISLKNWPDDSP